MVSGEYYFYGGRIHVLDVSNPRRPRRVGLYELPQDLSIAQLLASDDHLVVSSGSMDASFTSVLDVSEPSEPDEVQLVSAPELLLGISNGYAFFKYIEAGIPGIRVRPLTDITQSADWDESYWVLARAADVAFVADYAYFVGGGPAMAIINITDPRNPSPAGTFLYSPGDGTR